jgi:hypothetical protein
MNKVLAAVMVMAGLVGVYYIVNFIHLFGWFNLFVAVFVALCSVSLFVLLGAILFGGVKN